MNTVAHGTSLVCEVVFYTLKVENGTNEGK
jgi:hypothetical protein